MTTRMKDVVWRVSDDGQHALNVEHALLAVLMDIRDELKEMNDRFRQTIGCYRFQRIPRHIERIATRVAPTRPKRNGGRRA